MAHLQYLHCLKTFSRCCTSLFNNSGVEHMVLALCIRVLITLYLDARLWSLSHWTYRSVWVDFLYTFVLKVKKWDGTIRSTFFYSELDGCMHCVDMLEKLILV